MNKPRVIVCQHGARHRYAIPKLLEQAGVLKALYTDSCEYTMLGKLAKLCENRIGGKIGKLNPRKIIGVPKEKIFCSDYSTVRRILSFKNGIYGWREAHKALSKKMIRWYDGCDVFYNMYHENLEFLKFLQDKPAKIISDIYISPLSYRISHEECITEGLLSSFELVEFNEELYKKTALLSDILLCPSDFVADGVRELTPEFADKIRICPYGSSIDYCGRVNKPIKGRFFWAGGEWLRKGLHYLAKAADELKQKYPQMEFRAAGITDPQVIKKERFKNISFLGKLNKEQMQEEYLTADAFVFLTLSEGMAGTVIEAIAAGCPVITTKAAGVDAIEHGKNGLIIATKDSRAVVSAIEQLYLDRKHRNNIANETIKLAELYTEESWKKRLSNLVNLVL